MMRSALLVVILLWMTTVLSAQTEGNCAPSAFANSWRDTDFCNISVDFSEILSGGVPRDGIPALTNPPMESVESAQAWLSPQSPVIVVVIDDIARAYPQAILMWHEIANDSIGDVPLMVTFCPLCDSSIVFDRRIGDVVLEFGVSGNLRNSDMIMYDRETFSWWQQLTGEGIVGFYNEMLLEIIPSQVVGFAQFAERYPEGLVMSRETGYSRSYGNNPYVGLDSNEGGVTSLFTGTYDLRLNPRSRVLAVVVDSVVMAYPFETLATDIVINDQLGQQAVVAFWQSGVASSLDAYEIDASQDIGSGTLFDRTLANGTVLTFRWDGEALRDDQTDSTWNRFGEAIAGELAGTQLRRVISGSHFWFAWVAFHPDTQIYGVDEVQSE